MRLFGVEYEIFNYIAQFRSPKFLKLKASFGIRFNFLQLKECALTYRLVASQSQPFHRVGPGMV